MSVFCSRVFACALFVFAWLPRVVVAQADPAAGSPESSPPVVPLSAQGETMAPPSAAEQAPVPPPPSAAPAALPPAPSSAPTPAVPPPSAASAPAPKGPPAAQGHDRERPPPRPPRLRDVDDGPLLLRLSLGIEASFVRAFDVSSLRRPSYASFDIGYRPIDDLAIVLRLASWLPYSPYASQFLGVGVSCDIAPEGMYVTGVVGVAMVASVSPKLEERMQGLAAQLDLGQQWPLSAALAFGVGAHFELATPWLGVYRATDVAAGLFVALAYR